MELIPGNFKCHDITQDFSWPFLGAAIISDCVCARVANSHTFELYTKISNGDFEKVSSENENSNHMMDLARLPVKRRTPKSMMDLARLPVKRRTAKSMMDLARLPEKRMPAGNMMNLARLP